METFSTARLHATKLAQEDLPELVELHRDSEVSRFLGGVRSPAVTADYLAANMRHWADHGFGLWTLKTADGKFIGRAGLRYVDLEGARELEIAYTLVRSAWGQGIATEIARALVSIWEAQRSTQRLVGIVMKGNLPSERVLLKSGFHRVRDTIFHGELCSVFLRTQ